jgi:hypothetical protein
MSRAHAPELIASVRVFAEQDFAGMAVAKVVFPHRRGGMPARRPDLLSRLQVQSKLVASSGEPNRLTLCFERRMRQLPPRDREQLRWKMPGLKLFHSVHGRS